MGKDMTSGNPFKLIVFFTLPMLLGNVFQQFYSMADTFIVSRTLGMNALAAVGSTGSITFLIIGLATGLTAGLSVVTAQRFGRKDEASLRRSLGVGLIIALVASGVLTIFATTNTRAILELMSTPEEIINQSYAYLVVIFAGTGATVMFNYLSNTLRAIGDSRSPLIFLVIASILNIILDYIFILILNMDVEGAAYATIISQVVASLLCLLHIKRRVPVLRIYKEDWTLNWTEYKEHLRIGVPFGFQYSIIAFGTIVVQVTLNQLGALSVAAFTAANKIDQLLTMPLGTIGTAMATFAAQNFGARKFDRIKQGVRVGIKITFTYSIIIGLLLWFNGRFLASFFIDGDNLAALDLAEQFFKVQTPFYILLSCVFIFRLTLQGLGNSFVPTLAGVMELVARIFGAIILSNIFGFSGAVMSNPLAWAAACIPLIMSYYFTRKILNNDATPLTLKLSLGSKQILNEVKAVGKVA